MAKKSSRSKGTGTLYRHGRVWYAKWTVNGTTYRRTTGTANRKEAEAKLKEFVAPFQTESEIETLKNIESRIQTAADNLAVMNSAQQGLTLMNGWNVFKQKYKMGQQDPATMRNYEQWYFCFVDWLGYAHPEIKEMREVSYAISEEYGRYLLNGMTDVEVKRILEAREFLKAPHQSDGSSPLFAEKLEQARELSKRKIRKPVLGTTFNRHLNCLSLIWRVVKPNPVAGIGVQDPFSYNEDTMQGIKRIALKRENAVHRRSALTVEELRALVRTAEGEFRLLIYLGYYTGQRLGDCVLMKWSNFGANNSAMSNTTHKRWRELYCNVHHALASLLESTPKDSSEYVMPKLAGLYKAKNGEAEISKQLHNLFVKAGIATTTYDSRTGRGRPDKSFHSIRHSYNTHLMQAGISRTARQALMAHAQSSMTQYYEHPEAIAPLALPDIGTPQPMEPTATPVTPAPAACEPEALSDAELIRMLELIKTETEKRNLKA